MKKKQSLDIAKDIENIKIENIQIELICNLNEIFYENCSSPECFNKQAKIFNKYVKIIAFPTQKYIFIDPNDKRKYYFYTKAQLYNLLETIKTTDLLESGKIREVSFIKKWLKEDNKDILEAVVFDPSMKKTLAYNTFYGFKIANVQEKPENYEKYEAEWLKLIDILLQLTENNKEGLDYLLNVIANKIQFPYIKVQIFILIYGMQGVGKGYLAKIITSICEYTSEATDLGEVFEKHSIGNYFENKLFTIVHESNFNSSKIYQEKLKNQITELKLTINPKCMPCYEINNYSLIIAFSNQITPVVTYMDDRRKVSFSATNKYSAQQKDGHSVFWKERFNMLEDEHFIKFIYNKLMNINLKEFDIQQKPKTLSKEYMEYVAKTNTHEFIESLIIEINKNNNQIMNLFARKYEDSISIKAIMLLKLMTYWVKVGYEFNENYWSKKENEYKTLDSIQNIEYYETGKPIKTFINELKQLENFTFAANWKIKVSITNGNPTLIKFKQEN